MEKYVYSFNEGNSEMTNLLGEKSARLSEIIKMDLPVNNGFVVTSQACIDYYGNDIFNSIFMNISNKINETIPLENTFDDEYGFLNEQLLISYEVRTMNMMTLNWKKKIVDTKINVGISMDFILQIFKQITNLEQKTGKVFGDYNNPLLLSINGDTEYFAPDILKVLYLGLNDEIVKNISKNTLEPESIYYSYLILIKTLGGSIVDGSESTFDEIVNEIMDRKNITDELDLKLTDLIELVNKFKENYRRITKNEFPQNPKIQLIEAVKAKFREWIIQKNLKCRMYNWALDSNNFFINIQEIPCKMKKVSWFGTISTRNPDTGENEFYLKKFNKINVCNRFSENEIYSIGELETNFPIIYKELTEYSKILEKHFRDMQDVVFLIEDEKLYIINSLTGGRSFYADLEINDALYKEGIKERNISDINVKQLNEITKKSQEFSNEEDALSMGLGKTSNSIKQIDILNHIYCVRGKTLGLDKSNKFRRKITLSLNLHNTHNNAEEYRKLINQIQKSKIKRKLK